MYYQTLLDVNTFPWWAGAKDTIKIIKKANRMDALQTHLEDVFSNETPSLGQLNDFVWFNCDEILKAIGII